VAVSHWGAADRSQALSVYGTIGSWDVAGVTDMSYLFCGKDGTEYAQLGCTTANQQFNDDINAWDLSSVTDMSSMFQGATSFNQPLGNWNTSAVQTLSSMFVNAAEFNQPIGMWDVRRVNSLGALFVGAAAFNQPLPWSVSNVRVMDDTFYFATSFNQHLPWDLASATTMNRMFDYASSLDDCKKAQIHTTFSTFAAWAPDYASWPDSDVAWADIAFCPPPPMPPSLPAPPAPPQPLAPPPSPPIEPLSPSLPMPTLSQPLSPAASAILPPASPPPPALPPPPPSHCPLPTPATPRQQPPDVPAGLTEQVVSFRLTVSGTVEAFNDEAFRGALASLLSVSAASIRLRVMPASVNVEAQIILTTAATTAAVVNQIQATSIIEMSNALGVAVESVTAPVQLTRNVQGVSPPPSVPIAPFLQAPQPALPRGHPAGKMDNDTLAAIVAGSSGGLSALICCLGIAFCLLAKYNGPSSPLAPNAPANSRTSSLRRMRPRSPSFMRRTPANSFSMRRSKTNSFIRRAPANLNGARAVFQDGSVGMVCALQSMQSSLGSTRDLAVAAARSASSRRGSPSSERSSSRRSSSRRSSSRRGSPMAHNVPASRVLDGLPRGLLARWPSAGVEREDEWEPDLPDDLPNDLPDSPDVLGSPDESPTRSVRVGWVVSATERGQERGVRIDASAGVLAAEHSAEELSSDVGTPESPPVKPGWGRSLLEGRSLEKAAAEEDAMGDAAASSSFRRRRLLAVSRRVRSAAAAKQEGNVHADAHHDVTLSKHLSQLLRHKALEHGIQIDANGWALVSDALRWSNSMETNACMLRGEDATNVRAWSQYDVREMVGLNATFGVHRFVLREAQVGLQIRAVAKHTMRLPGVCRSCCRQASAAEVGGGLEVAAPSRVSTGAPEATGSFKNGSLAGSFKSRSPGRFKRRAPGSSKGGPGSEERREGAECDGGG